MSPWHRRAKQSPLALLNESRPLLLSREDVVHTLPYYDVDALRAFSFPEKSGANKQFPPPLGKIKIISIRNTIGGSNNSRSYDCSKPFPGKIWMPAAGYVLVNRDEVGSWEGLIQTLEGYGVGGHVLALLPNRPHVDGMAYENLIEGQNEIIILDRETLLKGRKCFGGPGSTLKMNEQALKGYRKSRMMRALQFGCNTGAIWNVPM